MRMRTSSSSTVAILLSACALFSAVEAHGGVTSYIIDGTTYDGYWGYSPTTKPTIQRQWPNFDPILTPLDKNIMCNGGTSAQLSAPAAPNSTITAVYKQWTHNEGPCTAYLYKCDGDFSTCDGKKKQWFKIAEVGLISGTYKKGTWCGTKIVENLKWTIRLPDNLAAGNYLIRHELLALHQANNPQFYPECAQLTVSGSGTGVPSEEYLTSFPGYAQPSDPNIKVPIDSTMKESTEYTCPGPKVWGNYSPVEPFPASSVAATASAPKSAARTTTRVVRATGRP